MGVFMEKIKPKFEYTVDAENISPVPVIVVAAGSASRMQGIDKQTMLLDGMPVIARTLSVLQKCRFVSRVILVTKKDSVLKMQQICEEYALDKVTDIIEGGETRHKSVLCGIGALTKGEETVLIHDGARPFLTENMIIDCIEALQNHDGCLCALKVSDTVKVAEKEKVTRTLSRDNLYLAQTPQGVNVSVYLKASKELKDEDFTDDASVIEAARKDVKIVNGRRNNIKITTREDIALANAIIELNHGRED